jgi:hypothetical protein
VSKGDAKVGKGEEGGYSCYHWLKLETVQGLVWEPLWTSLVKSHKTSSSVTAVLRGDFARHQGSY